MNITWRRRFFLLPELCPQRGEPLLERGNDVIADLGLREGDPVYKPTPTIDLIFGANDNLIGIAIHGDEALRLFDLLLQISDSHALVSICGLGDRAQRRSKILPEAGWQQQPSRPPQACGEQRLSDRFCFSPKNSGPDHAVPVIVRATGQRTVMRALPAEAVIEDHDLVASPRHSRISRVPEESSC